MAETGVETALAQAPEIPAVATAEAASVPVAPASAQGEPAAGQAIGKNTNSLLRGTLGVLLELLEGDLGAIVEPAGSDRHLELTVVAGPGAEGDTSLPTARKFVDIERTLAGLTWQTQSVVVTTDLTSDNRFTDTTLRRLGIVSALMAPIRVCDQSCRAIGVLRRRWQEFTAEDISLMESITAPLGRCIGRLQGRDEAFEGELSAPSRAAMFAAQAEPEPAPASDSEPSGRERRTRPRHEFHRRQFIGIIQDGSLPRPEEYFAVECVDLSTGGFAFVLDRPPSFNALVLLLDTRTPPVRLAARVVHVRNRGPNSHYGYEVGCQFLVRL